jgi:general secretion pathway protein F
MAGALAYPVLMLATGFAVLFFMMAYVVPNVVQIFRQAKRDLPLPTRILVRVSDFLVAYDLFLLAAAGALTVGFLFWRRTGAGRKVLDAWKLRLPLLGDLVHKRAIARFARTLGLLLAAGLPILDALAVAKHVMANTVMAEAAEAVREATRKGGRLSAALESGGVFPPLLVDMAAAGEDTGTLDAMLEHVAQQFEQETEASVQAMLSLVDPVLILAMGAAVGFVVIAILLPLFEISQLVR